MRKADIYKILFLVGFWVCAAIFYVFFEASILDFEPPEPGRPYSFLRILLIAVSVAFVTGTLVAFCEVLYLSRKLRRRPLGTTLLLKTAFYLACIFISTSLASLLIASSDLNLPLTHKDVWALFFDYMASAEMIMASVYWGIMVLLALFLVQVSEKFGPGVLLSFLLGKYYRPREEQRVFMFMDLKSSTTYAELLGHHKYSRLIQDCFYDLTDVVARYKADIYQYVGDEVVLTWRVDHGVADGNCLEIFYAFDEAILNRRAHYEGVYGLVPEFKAGINSGIVMAAEVGEIKKELAFHGDAINTASRIQGQCNNFDRRLLISGNLKNRLADLPCYKFSLIGEVALKGKQRMVPLYEVEKRLY